MIDSFIPKCIKAVIISSLLVLIFAIAYSQAAEVQLQWDENSPAPDGYRVFQREDSAYDYSAPVWTGTETTCTVGNLLPGHTYYFVVRAYVAENESGNSNEVNFTGVIPAPGNLRIVIEVGVYIDENGKPSILISSVR